MFILYFALWVILNGRWTPEIGAFGLAFAAVAYVFSCKFMGYSLGVDFALIRRAPAAIRYGVTLLGEIVKANLTVIRMILDKGFEPKPQLVHFDANLKRGRHLVTLANSITLTPGTITVNLEDNHFVVHCLDESLVEGLDDGVMITSLEAMERRSMKKPQDADAIGAADAADAIGATGAAEEADVIKEADELEAGETAEANEESSENEEAQTSGEGEMNDEH